MRPVVAIAALVAATATPECPLAGQGIPASHRDRVYAAEQFSNTVSVTDPADNGLVGVIRLGDPSPGNFSPLYRGQVLVHGLDRKSTRLNSSHSQISYAVFCLKKKKTKNKKHVYIS